MHKEVVTMPDNGVIYDGDYYKDIPFLDYIHKSDPETGKRVFDIRDYGAVCDQEMVCTQEIQNALDDCGRVGGGIVLVEGGAYKSGTLKIHDNTTLFISHNARLVASRNHEDFVDAFIIADHSMNIRITGGGRIYGNGEYFVYLPLKKPRLTPLEKMKLPPHLYDPMGYPVDTARYEIRARIRYSMDKYGDGIPNIQRPMYMVWINSCMNVTIDNIILEDAMDWNLNIDQSDNVTVKDMVINCNRHVANTDGIDVCGSTNVSVDHCFISCADDGMCVKAPFNHTHDDLEVAEEKEMKGASNISFTNCTVLTVANCFKIGTETYYDISDVHVKNCRFILPDIFPGTCGGISIESADGSNVSNVTVEDIEMDNISCPLFICLNKRNKFGFANAEDEKAKKLGGSIDNVTIRNIHAINTEVPVIITGYETEIDGKKVRRNLGKINVENFKVVYRDDVEELNPEESVHESVTDYPENNAFGDVPAYGIYYRHAPHLTLGGIDITPRSMNTRECIVGID